MRFKLDENLPGEFASLLRRSGHDAVTVLDHGLGGARDPDLASVCTQSKPPGTMRTKNEEHDCTPPRRSPLRNRVTPFGEIIETPARGTFFGNRGDLAKGVYRLKETPRWSTRGWIICDLKKDLRERHLMRPRGYTKLYFLDEATALAAGHRPCGQCRRAPARHRTSRRPCRRGRTSSSDGPYRRRPAPLPGPPAARCAPELDRAARRAQQDPHRPPPSRPGSRSPPGLRPATCPSVRQPPSPWPSRGSRRTR